MKVHTILQNFFFEIKMYFVLKHHERTLINKLKKDNLTYLSYEKLSKIVLALRRILDDGLNGICIEAGCALGGSTILISKIIADNKLLYVYDIFKTIPPPGKSDGEDAHQRYKIIADGQSEGIGGNKYYGYIDNLFETVKNNLKEFNINEKQVFLIQGLIENTMTIKNPVCFAHIDVDWYDSVTISLKRIMPNLVKGGVIILDDYFDWSGCKRAVDEYFKDIKDNFVFDYSQGSLMITKK